LTKKLEKILIRGNQRTKYLETGRGLYVSEINMSVDVSLTESLQPRHVDDYDDDKVRDTTKLMEKFEYRLHRTTTTLCIKLESINNDFTYECAKLLNNLSIQRVVFN